MNLLRPVKKLPPALEPSGQPTNAEHRSLLAFINAVVQNGNPCIVHRGPNGSVRNLHAPEEILGRFGSLYIYSHAPGRMSFMWSKIEDAPSDIHLHYPILPTATLCNHKTGDAYVIWALKYFREQSWAPEILDEYDFRIGVLMDKLGMTLEPCIPLPGSDGYELSYINSENAYHADELIDAFEMRVVPPADIHITEGQRYLAANVRYPFHPANLELNSVTVSGDRFSIAPEDIKLRKLVDYYADPALRQGTSTSLSFSQFDDEGAIHTVTGLVIHFAPGVDSDFVDGVIYTLDAFAIRSTRTEAISSLRNDQLIGTKYKKIDSQLIRKHLTRDLEMDEQFLRSIRVVGEVETPDGAMVTIGHLPVQKHQVLLPFFSPLTAKGEQEDSPRDGMEGLKRVLTAMEQDYSGLCTISPFEQAWVPTSADENVEVSIFPTVLLPWQHLYSKFGAALLPKPVSGKALTVGLSSQSATFRNALHVVTNLNLGLGFDVFNQRDVLRGKGLPFPEEQGREVTDDVVRLLRHYILIQAGIDFSKEDLFEAVRTIAQHNRFNPLLEWLDGLKWDGVSRLAKWLTTYAGVENSEYVRAVGRCFLIGAVRRARRPGVKFDTILILEGKQGKGKSSLLGALAGNYFSDAELGNLTSKDAAIALQGVWIYELPELTALNRTDFKELKAFASRSVDRFRAPYERVQKSVPRSCVFCGTTNESVYLIDPTGNRRYWPVTTGELDLDCLRQDRDQLIAEAAHYESLGESIVLSEHLWPVAAEQQAARHVEDPWVDIVRAHLDEENVDRVHTYDLLKNALDLDASKINQNTGKRLREVMTTIGGWEPKRSIRIGETNAAGYLKESP